MKLNKLILTAGAVGALGVAGSFGTFAAFTDVNPAHEVGVNSGTIKVDNNFQLPDLTNLGTRETAWNCDGETGAPTGTKECFGPVGPDASKRAGYIDVQNTGSLPQDVYLDFDGVGKIGTTSPNVESGDPLADNIIIDSALDPDFNVRGHKGTRLWVINRGGPTKYFTLNPGEAQRVYFRAHLRERFPGTYAGGDNEMQGRGLSKTQTVKVSAVEVGRDDLMVPAITAATDQGYPAGADIGKFYDYGE